jgi:acyl carrier protein
MSDAILKNSKESSGAPTAEEIRSWIVCRLARMLNTLPSEISADAPFVEYGLDSVEAIGLSGELSDYLGHRWPPTLAWDYSTINALSEYLARELKA